MIATRALIRAAALVGLAAFSATLRAQDAESVRVTTDPARVAGCAFLGTQALSDPKGLDSLRADAARRGANVIRLTRLSESGIAAELYRCGGAAVPAATSTAAPLPAVTRASSATPAATSTPARTPTPVPTFTPVPTAVPRPEKRSSKKTPVPPSTAERQRAAQQELESLKASVVVVSDPKEIEGCEKRGDVRGVGTTEDSLREDAVGVLANVVLVRRAEDGSISGDLYHCPRVQYQRLLAVTPPPVR